jgi:hypothetical protein
MVEEGRERRRQRQRAKLPLDRPQVSADWRALPETGGSGSVIAILSLHFQDWRELWQSLQSLEDASTHYPRYNSRYNDILDSNLVKKEEPWMPRQLKKEPGGGGGFSVDPVFLK